jgi:hypothetical protein
MVANVTIIHTFLFLNFLITYLIGHIFFLDVIKLQAIIVCLPVDLMPGSAILCWNINTEYNKS